MKASGRIFSQRLVKQKKKEKLGKLAVQERKAVFAAVQLPWSACFASVTLHGLNAPAPSEETQGFAIYVQRVCLVMRI